MGLHRTRARSPLKLRFERMAAAQRPNPINIIAQVEGSGTAGAVDCGGGLPPSSGGAETKPPPGGKKIPPGGAKLPAPAGTVISSRGSIGPLNSGSDIGPGRSSSGGIRNASSGLSGCGGNTLPSPRSTSAGGDSPLLPGVPGDFFVSRANVRSPGERPSRSPRMFSAWATAFSAWAIACGRSCGSSRTTAKPSATAPANPTASKPIFRRAGKREKTLFISAS